MCSLKNKIPTVHLPHTFRSRAEPGPWSPTCACPTTPLPPPRLLTTTLSPIFKAHPQTRFFCSTPGRYTCTMEWQHSPLSKPAHPPATRNQKGDREYEKQGPRHPHLYPASPVPVCWWLLHLHQESQNEGSNRDTLEKVTDVLFLTSASTCCWVRLWFSLYWLARRTCCSMPSRTASQPSHLQWR